MRFVFQGAGGVTYLLTSMLTISLVLPIIDSLLRLWLIARVFLMKSQREYPLFLAYNAFEIIDSVLLTIVMRRPVPFFLTYWIAEILLSILALLVLLAVFRPAAEGLYARHPNYRLFLPSAIVLVIAVSLWQMIYRPLRPTPLGHAASGMYSFVMGVLVLEAIVLVACLSLAFARRVVWPKYDFAIISGFGLSAMPKLVSLLVWWNAGHRFETVVHFMVPAAALGAALIWVIAFSRSEVRVTRHQPDIGELQRLTALLQEHSDYVREILAHPTFRRRSVTDQPR